MPSDHEPDPAALVDAEARRGGYRQDCERCRVALAVNGQEACTEHYVPTAERRESTNETPGPVDGRPRGRAAAEVPHGQTY